MYGTTYEKLVRVEPIDLERVPVVTISMEKFDEKSINTTLYLHRFSERQRQVVSSILPTVRGMILNDDYVISGSPVPNFEIVDGEDILVRFFTEGSTTTVAYRIYLTDVFEDQLKKEIRNQQLETQFLTFIGYGLAIGSAVMMGYLVGKGLFGRSI